MKKRKCPACGEKNGYDVSYCEFCAAKLSAESTSSVETHVERRYTTNGHDDQFATEDTRRTPEELEAALRKLKSVKIVKVFFIIFFILQLLPFVFSLFIGVLAGIFGV